MPDFPHRPASKVRERADSAHIGRTELAWQWLRRDPDYRRLAPGGVSTAPWGCVIEPAPAACVTRWGCLHIAAPDGAHPHPILWSAAVQPSVLRVAARPWDGGDAGVFDLRRWADHAALVRGVDAEHLLLHGAGRALRIDVVDGSLLSGQVRLRFDFGWSGDSGQAIATLRRFLQLCRTGDFAALPSDRVAAKRSIDALHVHDALGEGASIRDIGIMIFGADRVRADWHAPGEALKSHCRRLIAHARHMASGGYRALLR